jgi:polysaccharide biosynthesis protein PslJ
VTSATLLRADLEPSRVTRRTYATRRRPSRIDAVLVLSLMVMLLTLIPGRLIVPGMTDIGRPALIIALLLFVWWFLVRLTHHLVLTGQQPLRWAIFAFMTAAIISFAVGFSRPLTAIESNGADRMLLYFLMMSGIALMVADGVANWIRLYTLVKVIVFSCTVMGFIAVLEAVMKVDLTQYLNVPGLVAKSAAVEFETRGTSYRVASTAVHYIELSATLALAQPFAVHFALFAQTKWGKRLGIVAAVILAAGNAVTQSRTGIVALILMMLVMPWFWTWRTRYNIGVIAVGLLLGFVVTVPGAAHTWLALFDNPDDNSSIQARTSRYTLAWHYFTQTPWLGRGTGTWISPQYQVMDNQWIETAESGGVLGIVTLLALFITGMVLAGKALRRATTPSDRHLCACLIATMVMSAIVCGTFDALAFSTFTVMMTICIGLCGTVWRLTHPARTVRTSTTRWFLGRDGWELMPELDRRKPLPAQPQPPHAGPRESAPASALT